MLVIVPSHSRFVIATVLLPTRTTPDRLVLWQLVQGQLRALPHGLIWHNEARVGQWNSFVEGVTSLVATLATRVEQLRPFDQESRGGTAERAH